MPTDEIAHLLGFTDVDALDREGRVLARRIESGQALEPSDWRRALLAAEIVFASDLLGAGVDRSITTRFADEESIRLLRSLQRKPARVARLP